MTVQSIGRGIREMMKDPALITELVERRRVEKQARNVKMFEFRDGETFKKMVDALAAVNGQIDSETFAYFPERAMASSCDLQVGRIILEAVSDFVLELPRSNEERKIEMGYSFHLNSTKRDIVEYLTKNRDGSNAKVLAHAVTGNYLWMVIEYNGVKAIELAILSKSGNDYGYKQIGECAGPYHYGCPAKLIAMADAPKNESAAEWRAKNAKALVQQARAAERKVGDVVRYGKHEYRLSQALARGAFLVSRVGDGAQFTMSAEKFKDAEFM